MTTGLNSTTSRWSQLRTPLRFAAIVYLLAVLALRWGYPPSPRLVISAGPTAAFGGFTPDGKKMLTNYQPGWRLWDVHTGHMGPFMEAPRPGDPVGFTPDGKRFYVGSEYFSVDTGEKLPGKRYIGPSWFPGMNAIDVESPDGSSLAHNGNYKTIVGDANSGEERFQVLGGYACAFTPDSKSLITAVNLQIGPDYTKSGPLRWRIKLFDAATGNEQRTFAEDEGFVERMALSPDGTKLALAVETEKEQTSPMGIQVWDVATGQRVQTLPIQQVDQVRNIGPMRFLADGRVLAVQGGNILSLGSFAWDLTVPVPDDLDNTPDYLIGKMGFTFPFTALSADGRLAAIWDDKAKELQVRRLGNETTEIISRRSYAKNVSCWPQAFAAEERLIVHVNHAAGGDRTMMGVIEKIADSISRWRGGRTEYEVLDPLTGRVLGTTPSYNKSPTAGISPDGRTLVTHEMDLKLRDRFTFWNVPTPTPWLAIVSWALLPAVIVFGLLHARMRPWQMQSLRIV